MDGRLPDAAANCSVGRSGRSRGSGTAGAAVFQYCDSQLLTSIKVRDVDLPLLGVWLRRDGVLHGKSGLPREGLNGALPPGSLDGALLLSQLLSPPFVLVEGGEVVANDGDGKGDDEDATDGAARTDDLSETRDGGDVSIANLKKKYDVCINK